MRPLEPNDPRSIGSYTVLGVLGRGGMGKVYLGQSWTGKRVAIKVIRSEIADDPVFRQRFSREVEAGRAISALYTAPIVDADPEAETPWFATTYIEGPSLEDEVVTGGPMSVASVLILAAGLAESFIAIHRAGLVHRDLKPSNVLLTKDGPCVIDFGIALIPDSASLTQGVIGTPAYMSPEHISGGEVGPPSDIFSIGATLAFAATGQGPLGQGTPHSLIARLISGQLDTSAVPEQLKPIIHRCLARDPRYRPSAHELLGILAAAGATHPYPGWYSPVAPSQPVPPASGVPASGLPASGVPAAGAPGYPGSAYPGAASPGSVPAGGAHPGSAPASGPGYAPPYPPPYTPSGPPAPGTPQYGTPAYPGQPVPAGYPVPGGGQYPQGYPTYPAPARKSRRGLLIVVGLLALLLVGGGVTTAVAIAARGNADPQPTAGPSTPAVTTEPTATSAGKLKLSVPNTLAGLTKATEPELQKAAEQFVQEVKTEVGGQTEAVSAFYNDPNAAGKRVLFLGVTADIVSPASEIDSTFTSFNATSEFKIANIVGVPAGPLGGQAKCGDGKSKDITVVLCVWADNESLGMAIFYNRDVNNSAALFVKLRDEATSRV